MHISFETKFGNIAAAVNQTAGEMVFTLVRAARGGLDAEGEEGAYYEEEGEGMVAPEAPPAG